MRQGVKALCEGGAPLMSAAPECACAAGPTQGESPSQKHFLK